MEENKAVLDQNLNQKQNPSFSSSSPPGGGWLPKSRSSAEHFRKAHHFFETLKNSRWKFGGTSAQSHEDLQSKTDPTKVPRGSKLLKHHVDAIIFHYLFKQSMKAFIKNYRELSSRCFPPFSCCRSVRKSCNEFPAYLFSHNILPIKSLGEQPGQTEPYISSSMQPEK
jgi:hypothetical protein